MSKTMDKTGIILPKINRALETAGHLPAEVIQQKGQAYLKLSPGTGFRIHQIGALTPAMLPLIMAKKDFPGSVLWCQYVSEALADELTKYGFSYADTAGNMLLRFDGCFLQIRNLPKPKEIVRNLARGRSLSPSGLKVLFLLLTEPDAVTWNYRRIAAYCGTTIGTVNYAMQDLREKHYLLEDEDGRRLVNIRSLCRLWVESYRLRLLPKLNAVRYKGSLCSLKDDSLIHGGESAAAAEGLLQTNRVLLWKQGKNIAKNIIENRWHEDSEGNIEVREAFWPVEFCRFSGKTPWLLVYADLLAADDARCFEAAEEIRKRYLEKSL